jgi:hypothetical protein
MKKLNLKEVTKYVEEHIGEFHKSRLDKVISLQLKRVLLTKNPYLFKAKNVTQANEIVEGILDAYISSSEESAFGNWLERLAIFINDSVYQGRKAGIEGIDLDFDKEGHRYLVNIKSGPNWGNKDQVKKMIDQFEEARGRLQTSGGRVQPICVNGCCYGRSRDKTEYKKKGNYYKICGERFWELISGDPTLYAELIVPIGHEADIKNREYKEMYGALVNRMTIEFLNDFCDEFGHIDWNKLVVFNSKWPV